MYYDIYKKLLDIKKMKNSDVSRATGISNMTLSDWKNGKSTPKLDKLEIIAKLLGVTLDYLKGDTDIVICEVCGFADNPLSEESRKEHELFHNKFLAVKEKYPFFMKYSDADKLRNDSISDFRNPNKTIDERLVAFDYFLHADFSLEIARCNYETDNLNYEDFCKVEVGTLNADHAIPEDFIDNLVEKYGVDRNFMSGNEQLLARASNNQQLMRILAYAERLAPETLDSLEVQIKALADKTYRE